MQMFSFIFSASIRLLLFKVALGEDYSSFEYEIVLHVSSLAWHIRLVFLKEN